MLRMHSSKHVADQNTPLAIFRAKFELQNQSESCRDHEFSGIGKFFRITRDIKALGISKGIIELYEENWLTKKIGLLNSYRFREW